MDNMIEKLNYYKLMGTISNTEIMGIIPLDSLLHGIIGQIIYISCRKLFKLNSSLSLVIVVVIELLKEISDSFVITNTIEENIKDFLITLLFPVIAFCIDKYLSKPKIN